MYQYKFSDIEAQLQCALQWPHFIPPLLHTYICTLTPSCISRCPIEMILSDLKKSGLNQADCVHQSFWEFVNKHGHFLVEFFPLSNRVIWYFSPYQTESRVCNSSNFLFNTHITPVKCIWNFWNDDNTNNWRKVMENFSYMLKYDTEKKRNKSRVFIKRFYTEILARKLGRKILSDLLAEIGMNQLILLFCQKIIM